MVVCYPTNMWQCAVNGAEQRLSGKALFTFAVRTVPPPPCARKILKAKELGKAITYFG